MTGAGDATGMQDLADIGRIKPRTLHARPLA